MIYNSFRPPSSLSYITGREDPDTEDGKMIQRIRPETHLHEIRVFKKWPITNLVPGNHTLKQIVLGIQNFVAEFEREGGGLPENEQSLSHCQQQGLVDPHKLE